MWKWSGDDVQNIVCAHVKIVVWERISGDLHLVLYPFVLMLASSFGKQVKKILMNIESSLKPLWLFEIFFFSHRELHRRLSHFRTTNYVFKSFVELHRFFPSFFPFFISVCGSQMNGSTRRSSSHIGDHLQWIHPCSLSSVHCSTFEQISYGCVLFRFVSC